MKSTSLPKTSAISPWALLIRSGLCTLASLMVATAEEIGADQDKAPAQRKVPKEPVKDERPPGGSGSMFFRVFVSRNDKNGDGGIEKSEFRGGAERFDQMDRNKNGQLDRSEIDELHRKRVADPLSMRQRIERGLTRRTPLPDPSTKPKDDQSAPSIKGEPSATTPRGTQITAQQAFARLDVDTDGKVSATEFRRSAGMSDAKTAQEVVTRIDQDRNGTLSFKEFNAVFSKRHAKRGDVKSGPKIAPERRSNEQPRSR
jgi:hypothetical protein